MKKYLPNTKTSSGSGFTLIELMVVITILAILSAIGIGVYNGVQGNARDARKLAEINSLAKNIESTKDSSSLKYQYTSTLFNTDYPSGLTDPKFSTGYCISIASSAVTKPSNWAPVAATPCPANWTEIKSGMTAPTADLYFMVCAAAERGSTAICQGPFTK